MADLIFKATLEVEATLTIDSDGTAPRIVINKQVIDIDPSKLQSPDPWCTAEDKYEFRINGVEIKTTCGAISNMKGTRA